MTDRPFVIANFSTAPAEQPLRALRGCDVYGPGSKTGMSRSMVYREIAAGRFPPGFQIARNSRAWFEHEIDHWLLERAKNDPGCQPAQLTRGQAAALSRKNSTTGA